MNLPTSFDGAVAELRDLIADPLLLVGLGTFLVLLAGAAVLAWALVTLAHR